MISAALEDGGGAHPGAHAHGNDAVANPAPAHLVQEGSREARPGAAQRICQQSTTHIQKSESECEKTKMEGGGRGRCTAKGDGAAVDVDPV